MEKTSVSEGASAAGYLDEVFAEHRNPRDSGESLVEAIVRLLKRNRLAKLPAIREQLLTWVATMDGARWGIALEALTHDSDPRNALDLEALLRNGRKNHGWREALILALLRLRHSNALDLYRLHIIRDLDRLRPATLKLLQHLYALDFDNALDWSAHVFARLICRQTALAMTCVGHLIALSDINPAAVLDLVRKTDVASTAAANELRERFLEELQRPWVRERVGGKTANELRKQLSLA